MLNSQKKLHHFFTFTETTKCIWPSPKSIIHQTSLYIITCIAIGVIALLTRLLVMFVRYQFSTL